MIKTLSEQLTEWEDWDVASYSLAICLGIMDKEKIPTMADAKRVFGRIVLLEKGFIIPLKNLLNLVS